MIFDFNDPDPMTRVHFQAPDIDILPMLPTLLPIMPEEARMCDQDDLEFA